MALLRAADAGHITDPVVLIRLAAAMLFLVIGFAGGSWPPEVITATVALVAVAAGIVIQIALTRFLASAP